MTPTPSTRGKQPAPVAATANRQAISSLAGYDYQIWASIDAWLSLNPGDVIYLEGAEDFDVVSADEATTTQVKRTKTPVTLNSPQAKDAIRNYLLTREREAGRRIKYLYLTTSPVGDERDADFGGMSGIAAWKAARHDASTVELVRTHLVANLGADGTRLEFLKSASTTELQEQLFQPLDWVTDQPSVDAIQAAVLAKVRTKLQPHSYAEATLGSNQRDHA